MAEVHIWMLIAPFIAAIWWTNQWLTGRVLARWRHAVSALVSAIFWIYCAYASTRVVDASGGVEIIYGSLALSYVSAFMAIVSVAGALLGLALWTEEEAERTARELPESVQTGWDD